MAVTFTATPEPSNVPPRVRLEIATNDPEELLDEVMVRRDGVPIRAVMPTGTTEAVLYDYDCRFGTAVQYTVTGTTVGMSTLHEEDWADLVGWSTVSGVPAVAGARLTAGRVSRAIGGAFPDAGALFATVYDGAGSGEIQVGQMKFSPVLEGGLYILVTLYAEDLVTEADYFYAGFETLGSFVATWDNGLLTVNTESGAFSRPFVPTLATLPIECAADIPGFHVSGLVAGTAFDPLEDTVTLDVVEAWLIHPVDPDLSVQISTVAEGRRRDRIYVERDAAKRVTYGTQRELFTVMGRSRKVPVSYGNRNDGEWSLFLRVPRTEDRAELRALLADQSPILLRVPPAFPWDLDEGWYSVDDVEDERILDSPQGNLRTFELPLTPVDEPVLIQGAQWTYGDDLILNSTYGDSQAMFPTYLDRLVGPTS